MKESTKTIKITRKDIIEHRAMTKKECHDQAWHDFFATDKNQAITFAEFSKEHGDDYNDIAAKAEDYFDTMMNY